MPVTASDAALVHLAGLSLASATVFLTLPATEQQVADFVLVGHDGVDLDSDVPAALSEIERAAFEGESRNEVGEITLAVVSQTGSGGALVSCLASSLAVLGELDAAVQADPTLGGAVADSWISGVATFPDSNDAGVVVRRVVRLSFEALL
jgi:hypothetical protein